MKVIYIFTIFFCWSGLLLKAQHMDQTRSDEIFFIVEVPPQYPGGTDSLLREIYDNLTYPDSAIENRIEGKVYVKFVIDELGEIHDTKVMRDIGWGCGQSAIEAIRKLSKRFKPGLQRGQPVKVYFTLPVKFSLDEYYGFYSSFDVNPIYKDGCLAFYNYLGKNLQSDFIKKCQWEFTMCKLIFDKLGNITDVEITKMEDSNCMGEVKRVILRSTTWTSGKVRGKAVAEEMTFPLYMLNGIVANK